MIKIRSSNILPNNKIGGYCMNNEEKPNKKLKPEDFTTYSLETNIVAVIFLFIAFVVIPKLLF